MFYQQIIAPTIRTHAADVCRSDIEWEQSRTFNFNPVFKDSNFYIPFKIIVAMNDGICDCFFDCAFWYLILRNKTRRNTKPASQQVQNVFMSLLDFQRNRSG